MIEKGIMRTGHRVIFLVTIIVSLFIITGAYAESQDPHERTLTGLSEDLNLTNASASGNAPLQEYRETPQPITILKIELNETELPGPRYMAFGPSVISFSINYQLLIVLAIVMVICCAAWYLIKRRRLADAKTETLQNEDAGETKR